MDKAVQGLYNDCISKQKFSSLPDPKEFWALRRFVVKEHYATRLHWDFRLEINGVLKSWAMDLPPCLDPGKKQLARQVPDHSPKYLRRSGIIPPGQYGAGSLHLWDEGMIHLHAADPEEAWLRGELRFTCFGTLLNGEWRLIRMPGGGGRRWRLEKIDDDFAVPGHSGPVIGIDGPKPPSAAARQTQMAFDFPTHSVNAAAGYQPKLARRRRRL